MGLKSCQTLLDFRQETLLPLEVRKTCIFKTRSLIKVSFSMRFVTSPQYTKLARDQYKIVV